MKKNRLSKYLTPLGEKVFSTMMILLFLGAIYIIIKGILN